MDQLTTYIANLEAESEANTQMQYRLLKTLGINNIKALSWYIQDILYGTHNKDIDIRDKLFADIDVNTVDPAKLKSSEIIYLLKGGYEREPPQLSLEVSKRYLPYCTNQKMINVLFRATLDNAYLLDKLSVDYRYSLLSQSDRNTIVDRIIKSGEIITGKISPLNFIDYMPKILHLFKVSAINCGSIINCIDYTYWKENYMKIIDLLGKYALLIPYFNGGLVNRCSESFQYLITKAPNDCARCSICYNVPYDSFVHTIWVNVSSKYGEDIAKIISETNSLFRQSYPGMYWHVTPHKTPHQISTKLYLEFDIEKNVDKIVTLYKQLESLPYNDKMIYQYEHIEELLDLI